MTTLNRFQVYSQGENMVTNNVLLLFSNLYEIHPRYFEEYVSALIEESNYDTTPIFNQQVNNKGNGFIDGMIDVNPSKIIIETKLQTLENKKKLLKHIQRSQNI
jgi:hypothetical protein